jgi:hypothetical protein
VVTLNRMHCLGMLCKGYKKFKGVGIDDTWIIIPCLFMDDSQLVMMTLVCHEFQLP